MKKVNILWRFLVIILIGYSLGTFVTIKYMVPPSTEISVGKIKLKGDGNSVSDVLDATPGDLKPSKRDIRIEERKDKRDIRKRDRAIKKETRKRNRDGG